jgi:hypothetical protein
MEFYLEFPDGLNSEGHDKCYVSVDDMQDVPLFEPTGCLRVCVCMYVCMYVYIYIYI